MKKDKVQELTAYPVNQQCFMQKTQVVRDFQPNQYRSRLTKQVLQSRMIPMLDSSVVEYQKANRKIVKSCAKKYIFANVCERNLLKFMLNSLKYEHLDFMTSDNVSYSLSEYEESEYITDVFSDRIRKDERWFNDLMLYLSGVYTDGQLLNADFFRVINNPRAKKNFVENTKCIDSLIRYRAMYAQKILNENKGRVDKSMYDSQQVKQK